MTALVGLDLAWSGRNPSGYCVLRADQGGRVELEALGDCVMPPAEALQWLGSLGPDVVAAIDAPLIIGHAEQSDVPRKTTHPAGLHDTQPPGPEPGY
jgi:predicted RNase H-like nuclease